MDTVTNEVYNQIFDFDQFAPSTYAVIGLAQQEAMKMNAPEVYPEHLFLGVLRGDDSEVTLVMKDMGLNRQKIQAQAQETFGSFLNESTENQLLFSRESQACFEWALAFATQMNSALIFPRHLLLSVLRHPRIQPLLVLLVTSQDQDVLTAPLLEVEGHAYTSYIDQLIRSRVRERSVTAYNQSSLKQVFSGIERPHSTFGDIQGLDGAKETLREVVDFLRKPQNFQQSMRTYLYGVLMVGHPCTDRTLLVKAIAGEAVVPLIHLSLSALVELLIDSDQDVVPLDELDPPDDEYELLVDDIVSLRGQNVIAHIFKQAKKLSPCVLFFDDLDAINRLSTSLEREQIVKQLAVELDGLDHHPPMAVIATTSNNNQLDQALQQPGRFEHRVVMSNSILADPLATTKLCLSCKYEVLATWKYCVFCGAFIGQTCPNCGNLLLQLTGARYCSECGAPQRETGSI